MNPSAETQMAIGIGPQVFTESESFYRAALESLSEGVMIEMKRKDGRLHWMYVKSTLPQ